MLLLMLSVGFGLVQAQLDLERPLQINIFPTQNQQKEEKTILVPPQITVSPPALTNKEILYLGGLANPDDTILIFLQRGREAIITAQVQADNSGGWFYTHKGFLSEGDYKVWARSRDAGGVLSANTESIGLEVVGAAIEIGSFRLSFKSLYVTIIGILSILVTIFLVVVVIMVAMIRYKKRRLQREVFEAHQSVKRGYDILKDDIHKELNVLKELEKGKTLSSEEKARQEKLMRDLDFVIRFIEKGIVDVEKLI